MSPALLTLLTFLAGALIILGIGSLVTDLFLRDRERLKERMDAEFGRRQRELAQKSKLFKDFRKFGVEAATLLERKPTLWTRFEALIAQSGTAATPQRVLLTAGSLALAVGFAVGVLIRDWRVGVLIALFTSVMPLLSLQLKRRRRQEKMLGQLPDAFELMARVIRSGQTMSQALQAVADEFQPPIAAEFAYCYEQQNLGLPPEIAFRDLGRRAGLVEIQIFILAVLVQRQTGGNLAELLEKLASIVRERFRIRGKIRVLTAEGRLEAVILLALPFLVYMLMLIVNREYALVLIQYPSWIIAMLVMMTIGALWIRRIVNFDF